MDGAATTGLMAIMATMERDLQMPSQSLLLPLSPRLMLMPGTAITATAATDGGATTGLITMATMERGPQMLSQPTAAADPNADADAWYGHYGYGYRRYGWGGYYRPYGYYGYWG